MIKKLLTSFKEYLSLCQRINFLITFYQLALKSNILPIFKWVKYG